VYRSGAPVFNDGAVNVHSGLDRTVTNITGGGTLLDITDSDPPFNEPFYYLLMGRARAGGPLAQLALVQGCPPQINIPTDQGVDNCVPVLLSDPARPQLNAWAGLLSIDALSYPARRELFEPYGRRYPVAVSNVRGAARTTIRLLTRTLTARNEMLNVTQWGGVLCFRMVDPDYPESLLYISLGDITESRLFEDHRKPERVWTFDVAVVQRPVVGVVAVTRTSWATYSGQPPGNATGLLAGKSYNTILAENYSWQKLIDGVPVATGKGAAHEVAFAQPGTHAVADAWSES
jgi:hypothetical protein